MGTSTDSRSRSRWTRHDRRCGARGISEAAGRSAHEWQPADCRHSLSAAGTNSASGRAVPRAAWSRRTACGVPRLGRVHFRPPPAWRISEHGRPRGPEVRRSRPQHARTHSRSRRSAARRVVDLLGTTTAPGCRGGASRRSRARADARDRPRARARHRDDVQAHRRRDPSGRREVAHSRPRVSPSTPRAVVFDLGGTLVHWPDWDGGAPAKWEAAYDGLRAGRDDLALNVAFRRAMRAADAHWQRVDREHWSGPPAVSSARGSVVWPRADYDALVAAMDGMRARRGVLHSLRHARHPAVCASAVTAGSPVKYLVVTDWHNLIWPPLCLAGMLTSCVHVTSRTRSRIHPCSAMSRHASASHPKPA